jgi:hypothetical protein
MAKASWGTISLGSSACCSNEYVVTRVAVDPNANFRHIHEVEVRLVGIPWQ